MKDMQRWVRVASILNMYHILGNDRIASGHVSNEMNAYIIQKQFYILFCEMRLKIYADYTTDFTKILYPSNSYNGRLTLYSLLTRHVH